MEYTEPSLPSPFQFCMNVRPSTDPEDRVFRASVDTLKVVTQVYMKTKPLAGACFHPNQEIVWLWQEKLRFKKCAGRRPWNIGSSSS